MHVVQVARDAVNGARVLVVRQPKVFRALLDDGLDLELVLVRERREEVMLDLHLEHASDVAERAEGTVEIGRGEQLVGAPVAPLLEARVQRVRLVDVGEVEAQDDGEVGHAHRQPRKEPCLAVCIPREEGEEVEGKEVEGALEHARAADDVLVDARDDRREDEDDLEGGLEDVQRRPRNVLAQPERVQDLIWVVLVALAVGVVLSDVLEMPRVRWEEHRHVKELPREPVLHAPVDGLVADAREAHPRPHVDEREGNDGRTKGEEAYSVPGAEEGAKHGRHLEDIGPRDRRNARGHPHRLHAPLALLEEAVLLKRVVARLNGGHVIRFRLGHTVLCQERLGHAAHVVRVEERGDVGPHALRQRQRAARVSLDERRQVIELRVQPPELRRRLGRLHPRDGGLLRRRGRGCEADARVGVDRHGSGGGVRAQRSRLLRQGSC
mmetsp:Transcript_41200/g.132971  ORF Transcript_41200/g.132971 Transcript_41200/m.132971 type:complete len:438 (+) Transcript_41200:395-1708(+)